MATFPISLVPFSGKELSSSSVISDLTTYDFRVGTTVKGEDVAAQFNLNSYLPGVMIVEDDRLVAAISRQRFLAIVGQRHGADAYLTQPISTMVNTVMPPHLTLSYDCNVQEAAQRVFFRPSDLFYEPIIVSYPDGAHRILDVYTLLDTQSYLLTLFYKEEQNQRQLAESLQQIGQALSSTLDLSLLNNQILQQLFKVVAYERGIVFTSDGESLRSIAKRGFPEEFDQDIAFTLPIDPHDVYRVIMNTRQPVIIPDVSKIETWQGYPGLPLNRSWLGVPLTMHDRVIGMVSLTRKKADAFTEYDINIVQMFAGQAAVSLENARLYNKLERFNEELEEMVDKRTKELQETYNLVEKLDKAKSDFIAVTAHELRTPLTIIRGFAQLLELNNNFDKESIEFSTVKGLTRGVDRMHRVINGMLDIARIDNDAMIALAEPVSLQKLIDELQEKFAPDLREREIKLSISPMDQVPIFHGDGDLLYKLFSALLVNAIKYTPNKGEIKLTNHLVKDKDGLPQEIRISVTDTGIGIDPEDHQVIFQKFYQTGEISLHSSGRTKYKGGGSGLGLAIAKGVIRAHNGRIWVESEGHNEETFPGSSFHVALPLTQIKKN